MFPVELVFPLPEGGHHMAKRTIDGVPQMVVKTIRAHSEAELRNLTRLGWKQRSGPTVIEGELVRPVLPVVR